MTRVNTALTKRWRVAERDGDTGRELARALGIHPVTGELLARRGLRTPADALRFLNPSLDDAHDPLLLPDCRQAVERIVQAISRKETIFVHGDYDVDGLTSAALLTRVLGSLGAKVIPFVPSRSRDGYGVSVENVERAAAEGAKLLVTSDCGVSAHDACQKAKQIGLDVVVTDHHPCPQELPVAHAVVNPARPDSRYPFPHLAGVGVAYKLCQALCQEQEVKQEHLHSHFLDLVALGTVSDVVPLLDENRLFVTHGLKSLPRTRKRGLIALMASAGVDPARVSAEAVGFALGPRLNAAGRIAEASEALDLLLTRDADKANSIASEISAKNSERQRMQKAIAAEALAAVPQQCREDDRVLVVGGEGWHPGVVGIVAAKLVDTFWRPAVVLCRSNGEWHGSGRSIPGFDLGRAIEALGSDIVNGGGHAMAAGLACPADRLEEMRRGLNELASEWLSEEDLTPTVEIEQEIGLQDIGMELACEIGRLEPYGEGNPQPVFTTSGVRLTNAGTMGSDGAHFRAALEGVSTPHRVIGWRMGELAATLGTSGVYNICYTLKMHSYNGTDSVDVVLCDAPTEGP